MVTDYFRLLRVSHWIKNVFVFVPILFSKHLLDWNYLSEVILAFITFSLTASMIYIFNDLKDAEFDRQHPVKKFRPIASRKITERQAIVTIIILFLIVVVSTSQLNWEFAVTIAAYIIINILYTLALKNIIIVDLFCIASGFMLRVLAGAYVINIYISDWLILTTIFLALFLAAMKRRSEINASEGNNSARKVLQDYSERLIDQITATGAGGLIICYGLYSISDRTLRQFHSEYFVFTTAFVIFGVFRYMYLVLKKSKGENPTEIMLTDIPMILNTVFYIAVIFTIIYIR